jgi:uncharacterized membrane protein (Fun14 family)
MAAFFLGASFIFVQTLQHSGYIQVNYDRVQQEVEVMCTLVYTLNT